MTPPLRVLVVAHTHWDREWYHPAGRFRQRLVALVDELLDDPPTDGESFLLDGQAIVLDDYLAVRPERTAELAALLREGRLEAGPWYVLADGLIPSGEALVRNLLAGRDVLRRMRAVAPPVLYCPDSFGHPAILPDLAAGFGCELIIAWRGYGGRRWPAGDMVRWRGAAGSSALLYHLAPDGYELGSSLPLDVDDVRARWRRFDDVVRPRAATGIVLLLNGADHHARQRAQREAVHALAEIAAPDRVESSTLDHAAAELSAAAARVELPMVQGELRDSYGYTWTLQGTLASRAAQKRRNAQLERTLVRDVEPWIALGPRSDGAYAGHRALLRAAWRALLEGHPHDTLCGTSIDDVAIALDARHADVATQSEGLRADAIAALVGHDVERARHSQAAWRPVVVLRNRAARPRDGVVELRLSATLADVAVGPGSADRQGERRRMPPWHVEGMPLQILRRRERVSLTESPRDYPDADLVAEADAVGWVAPMRGYGIETRAQRPDPRRRGTAAVTNPVAVDANSLDNGLLRIDVSDAGIVQVTDLSSGRIAHDLLALEVARDAGDLYTPAIRGDTTRLDTTRVRVVHRGPLRGEIALDFRVPATPSGKGGARGGRCRVSLVLDANALALVIRVQGVNANLDSRTRLRFRTGLAGATTVADAAFHPIERVPFSIPREDAEMEQVVPTAPLHRWVTRFTASAGATIFSDGLAEYEGAEDGSVAITLVRAVGALSRHDLPERPGHAGWPADTPLAQSIGPYAAKLAFTMHEADSLAVREHVERLADDVLLPLVGETLRSNLDEPRANAGGGLELEGAGLAFSAAMPAREEGWIVLRCVNRRDERVEGAWRTDRIVRDARLARLDETPLDGPSSALPAIEGDIVRFVAGPLAIVTLLVRWD